MNNNNTLSLFRSPNPTDSEKNDKKKRIIKIEIRYSGIPRWKQGHSLIEHNSSNEFWKEFIRIH